MNSGWRHLPLAAAVALCVAGCTPKEIAEKHTVTWGDVVADIQHGFGRAASKIRSALHLSRPKKPTMVAAQPDAPALPAASPSAAPGMSSATPAPVAPPTLPGLTLQKPQAAEAAAALKQAYAIAIANERIKMLGVDPKGIADAVAAYKTDNLAAGDAAAATSSDPLARTALEWMALHNVSYKVSLGRLKTFQAAHPDWPAPDWLRHQVEARLLRLQDPREIESYFMADAPDTALGKLALAKALKSDGRAADAARIVRAVFRESDLPGSVEAKLKTDFGDVLTKGDYKYRADRLLYKEQVGPALRAAAYAGPDVLALAKARAAIIDDQPSDKLIAAVPAPLREDPGLVLQEIQKARRADKLEDAAVLMRGATRDPAELVDADEWWTERRVLARALLDTGNAAEAYEICANHAPASRESDVEAEFHAGWIALRYLNDPVKAKPHFDAAAKLAETPTSIARIAYWQGRTATNSLAPDAIRQANAFYRKAASYGSTYYGQLARKTLGLADVLAMPVAEAKGDARSEAIRVVELLYAAGAREAATALAIDAANSLTDDAQGAALATVIASQQDAHLALTIGKLMSQRGLASDALAFPTFGIPPYEALQNSAPPSVVYSVARQESAFQPSVVSRAGAKGLMQMIDSTARRTATKAGLPYDGNRMLSDAAFNARLGAAHLGALIAEQGGSYILTFAAYNAGGGRVHDWIVAYGDPRQPGVDPVDWVERIPFTETRNYVQRVMANVGVYQAIFDARDRLAAEARAKLTRPDREAQL
jgi:soluble lytic murein transglycosylase